MTNPLLPTTFRNKNPNTKIDPLLKHAIFEQQQAILIFKYISIYEQTVVMQGKHKNKPQITYKKEGDGFQCDTVCAERLTYSFQPPPSDNTPCDLSDLHKRVMSLFNQLKRENYACDMDNLYMYVKLEKVCKTSKSKAMVSGVCRQKGRVIPTYVYQLG